MKTLVIPENYSTINREDYIKTLEAFCMYVNKLGINVVILDLEEAEQIYTTQQNVNYARHNVLAVENAKNNDNAKPTRRLPGGSVYRLPLPSGAPPEPQEEIYKCASCTEKNESFVPQHGIKPEHSCESMNTN